MTLVKNLRESSSDSMYICGSPGTGKSLTVERVIQTIWKQQQNDDDRAPFTLHWVGSFTLTPFMNMNLSTDCISLIFGI
jgi:Cdc6-like AAA superfamily ATPase